MKVKLEDVCERGSSSIKQFDIIESTGDYPIFGAAGYIRNVDFYQQEKPYVAVVKDGAGIGRTTLYPAKSSVIGTMQYLLPKENVLPEYLCYVVRYMHLEKYFTGSTIPHIYFKDYKNEQFNLDPWDVQKQIVNVLGKCEKIISDRQSEIVKLDDLIKARFVEMFGDPIQNPKGWDMPLIEDVVANEKNALKAGPFGSALKKEYYVASGYKIYGQEQVISGDCTFGDYYIDEERYKSLENCAIQPGDVLISLVGTYGKLLVIPEVFEPGIINPRLVKITFDKEKVNPYYFKFFFQSESLKKALSENTHGGTMDILNLGIVRKIEMPLPPLKLQNEFVAFVYQVDKSKFDGMAWQRWFFSVGMNPAVRNNLCRVEEQGRDESGRPK